MKRSILIVEDLFIEANNLRLILDRAGYTVLPIASTFPEVMEQLERLKPDLVLLDIYLRGSLTGIDVAKILAVRKIPFIFLSANTNRKVFQAAKATKPYGFLVKPFRQRDVLAALEVAIELHDVVERGAMIIAATNRRLDEEVAAGRFRTDLYYRLNVFPIVLPPLRERKEDIPLLANFFLKRFALLERKVINGFAADVMMAMERYSWPGNVREMENLMRRTVLLTKGPIVTEFYQKADLAFGIDAEARFSESESRVKSMAENERDHIVATLKACNWKVYGPGGAAELLAINVSTLNSRMKKLGIQKARPERK